MRRDTGNFVLNNKLSRHNQKHNWTMVCGKANVKEICQNSDAASKFFIYVS